MVLDRVTGSIEHRHFYEIVDYLRDGDVLVLNDSRVIPARLWGQRVAGGGKVEILLLRQVGPGVWEALVKPGRRVRVGTTIEVSAPSAASFSNPMKIVAEVMEERENGIRVIRFSGGEVVEELGQIPLPPYIHSPLSEPERYQTVYARVKGSVAAPTAGLHFTPELLKAIDEKGVQPVFVTLHIGLDTFRPVRVEDPCQHPIHSEYGELTQESAHLLNRAKAEGRRIICVGTSAVRLIEAVAQAGDGLRIRPFAGWVNLFILPGYQFQVVSAMVSNFHLPRSTLLMLVSAFAGEELTRRVYEEAVWSRYRFYSFGDAMLII